MSKKQQRRQWIAIVTLKPTPDLVDIGRATGLQTAYGPFDEYDCGIKMWSAHFADKHQGTFVSIDYLDLKPPGKYKGCEE